VHCPGRSTNELDTAEEGEVITGNILYILDWLGGQQPPNRQLYIIHWINRFIKKNPWINHQRKTNFGSDRINKLWHSKVYVQGPESVCTKKSATRFGVSHSLSSFSLRINLIIIIRL
jgi:hypothetical protein